MRALCVIENMSQESIKAKLCNEALLVAKEKVASNSNSLLPMYQSIENQLQFLVDFFEGKNNEHAKLHTLNFGHLAVRELEDNDPKFAHLLKVAFYVADKTANGLKLDERFIANYT
jgi:hypothetical protein